MSEKWSKEFDSCFQVGSIEEIADALEKRSGSEENALAMLAIFLLYTVHKTLSAYSLKRPQLF
ncbi:TPA: hypothetical protein H2U81_004707 [Salmonella enterica]|nr:hypothetical protein [Salmonella enterica]